MGRCTEMRELGKNTEVSRLKELSADLDRMLQKYEQVRDSVAAAVDSQGGPSKEWRAAGLAEPGFVPFVNGLQKSLKEQQCLVGSHLVSRTKKAIADALAHVGALPSEFCDGEAEQAFRNTMSKNAQAMIECFNFLSSAVKELGDLPTDQDGDVPGLVAQTARMAPLLEFHVCFYSALTLYRSPAMSDAGGPAKAKLYGNLQTICSKMLALRFADGQGPPKHAEALLGEMCAFVALLVGFIGRCPCCSRPIVSPHALSFISGHGVWNVSCAPLVERPRILCVVVKP